MRQSGILMHITSLPSPGGIGDLGGAAYAFADFLQQSGMRIWQVLPIGPTGYGESPYQSTSAFAGNPLLISPEKLREEGLLTFSDEELYVPADPEKADYDAARENRTGLLRRSGARPVLLFIQLHIFRIQVFQIFHFRPFPALKSFQRIAYYVRLYTFFVRKKEAKASLLV